MSTEIEELPEVATIPQAWESPEPEPEVWRIPVKGIAVNHTRHDGRATATIHVQGRNVPRFDPDSIVEQHRQAVEASEEFQAYSKLLASFQAKQQELTDLKADVARLTKQEVDATVAGENSDKIVKQLPALRSQTEGLASLIDGMRPHLELAFLVADAKSRELAKSMGEEDLRNSREEKSQIEEALANAMGPFLVDLHSNSRRYNAATDLYSGKLGGSVVPQPPTEQE